VPYGDVPAQLAATYACSGLTAYGALKKVEQAVSGKHVLIIGAGGVGLAGEAGPEAIMPLARGPDGKLGVTGRGGGNSITIQIATPDLESFRRSENYITGQIARAVSRGQRNL